MSQGKSDKKGGKPVTPPPKRVVKTVFMPEYRELIQALIKVRQKLSLTQTEVAKQAGWSDHTYISKLETFERRLDVVDLAKLSKIYRKPTGYFMKYLDNIPILKSA